MLKRTSNSRGIQIWKFVRLVGLGAVTTCVVAWAINVSEVIIGRQYWPARTVELDTAVGDRYVQEVQVARDALTQSTTWSLSGFEQPGVLGNAARRQADRFRNISSKEKEAYFAFLEPMASVKHGLASTPPPAWMPTSAAFDSQLTAIEFRSGWPSLALEDRVLFRTALLNGKGQSTYLLEPKIKVGLGWATGRPRDGFFISYHAGLARISSQHGLL